MVNLKRISVFFILLAFSSCIHNTAKQDPSTPAWKELETFDLNIIPCPKKITGRQNKELQLTAPVLKVPKNADERFYAITDFIASELKCSLRVYKADEIQGGATPISLEITDASGTIPGTDEKLSQREQSYRIIVNDKGVILQAAKIEGLYNAAGTFVQMLHRRGNAISVPLVEIIDWPDFKKRCGNDIQMKSFESARKTIDFFFKYKYNYCISDMPPRESWSECKKINEYAKQKGIKIIYFTRWAVGKCSEHKNDPRFKGCVSYAGDYYCWSDDELLNEAAEKHCTFVKETDAAAIAFHCVDSCEENWPERCDKCRKRFGNDRAAADAHVINLFTGALRKINKNIELSYVTYPYGINLDLNPASREYYKRLSPMIPDDVFLNVTGYNHDAALSWNKEVKQPLVRWQNGSTFQIGRFFDSVPCFFKGLYFPARRDMAFMNEPLTFFDGSIMLLVGMEYIWNTEAPGATMLRDNPNAKITEDGPYKYRAAEVDGREINYKQDGSGLQSAGFDATKEPYETCNILLDRVCRNLYGSDIAPAMADYLRAGLKGWRAFQVAEDVIDADGGAKDQFSRSTDACRILAKAMSNKNLSKEDKDTLKRFYKRTLLPNFFYEVSSRLETVNKNVADGNIDSALKDIESCSRMVADKEKEFKNSGLFSPQDLNKWATAVNDKIKLANCRINFYKKGNKERNVLKSGNSFIKVAIYNPENSGGALSVFDTLYNCLKKIPAANIEIIDNLQINTLSSYDVLIIPQIKKFGKGDAELYKDSIRRFVLEKGGGVYFEHDATGFYRSATPQSLFPEICAGGEKREETAKVKISRKHPALEDMDAGKETEHMYWDHITLSAGPSADIIVSSESGKPVVIAGKVGKGRVIFSGMVTLGRDDKEKSDASDLDKILLTNGILWLSGKNNLIKNPSFENKKDGKVLNWYGNGKPVHNAVSGTTALSLSLSPVEKYSEIKSDIFNIEPDSEYYLEMHCRKDANFRVVPMLVVHPANGDRFLEIPLEEFPVRKSIPEFETFSGIIKTGKDCESGAFRLYADWYGGNPDSIKNVVIDDVSLIKVK